MTTNNKKKYKQLKKFITYLLDYKTILQILKILEKYFNEYKEKKMGYSIDIFWNQKTAF